MNSVQLSRGSTIDLERLSKTCFELGLLWLQSNLPPTTTSPQHTTTPALRAVQRRSAHVYFFKNITSTFPLEHNINLESGKSTMFSKLSKGKKEKTCGEYVYRTCRVIIRINGKIQFANPFGLKLRIINLMWKLIDHSFSDSSLCTLQLRSQTNQRKAGAVAIFYTERSSSQSERRYKYLYIKKFWVSLVRGKKNNWENIQTEDINNDCILPSKTINQQFPGLQIRRRYCRIAIPWWVTITEKTWNLWEKLLAKIVP